MKLTEEQFEALEDYVLAVAEDVVGKYFNRTIYTYKERDALWDLLVKETEK